MTIRKTTPGTNIHRVHEVPLNEGGRNHARNDSILQHNVSQHCLRITTKQILDATKVMHYLPLKVDLILAETFYIKESSSNLNAQREGEYRVSKYSKYLHLAT